MAMLDDLIGGFTDFFSDNKDILQKAGKATRDAMTAASKQASSISDADLTRGVISTRYGEMYNPGRVDAAAASVDPTQYENYWKSRLNAFANAEAKAEQTRASVGKTK